MKNQQMTVTNGEQSAISQFSNTDIDIIKNSVAKGTTDAELKYFLAVAASTGLNPFQKEIWCYKSGNDMLIFAGRDGFLANAQKKPDYKGFRSSYVCENDKFEMNIPAGHISHSHNGNNRGKITGAYAIVKRDGMESFIEWASMEEFNKGYNAWKTNPGSMIKKVAEAHALKAAYALNGIHSEHDYDFQRNSFGNPQTEETTFEEIKNEPVEVIVDDAVLTAIDDAKTLAEVTDVYNSHPQYHAVETFIKALGVRKQAIKKTDKESAR